MRGSVCHPNASRAEIALESSSVEPLNLRLASVKLYGSVRQRSRNVKTTEVLGGNEDRNVFRASDRTTALPNSEL